MLRLVLALALIFTATSAFAQGEIHNTVDDMPELVGGLTALQQHIHYPDEARDERLEGRVMVQFVVDEEGNVTEPSILQGEHPSLNEAALEALEHVEFTPGRHEGQPAKVRMILPITFVLPEETRTEENVAEHVDEMPAMIGGMRSLVEHLVYPEEAKEQGIEGRVIISFIVNVDGEVEDAEVGRGAHPLIDQAALEAIQQTRFTPGLKNGEAVRVRMALPVNFEFSDLD